MVQKNEFITNMKLSDVFINTSEQKILSFLAQNLGEAFFDKEIAQKTEISRGATNKALRELTETDLIVREKRGRMNFYHANAIHPILKEFKVLKNIIKLFPLVKKLAKVSEKIILFGSASRGEDFKDSDIDLFVLTHNIEEVKKIIKKSNLRLLQSVIKTPAEFIAFGKREPSFHKEIMMGIVFWERCE